MSRSTWKVIFAPKTAQIAKLMSGKCLFSEERNLPVGSGMRISCQLQWSGQSHEFHSGGGWFYTETAGINSSFKTEDSFVTVCLRLFNEYCIGSVFYMCLEFQFRNQWQLIEEQTNGLGWKITLLCFFLSKKKWNRHRESPFMIPCGWSIIPIESCTDAVSQEWGCVVTLQLTLISEMSFCINVRAGFSYLSMLWR